MKNIRLHSFNYGMLEKKSKSIFIIIGSLILFFGLFIDLLRGKEFNIGLSQLLLILMGFLLLNLGIFNGYLKEILLPKIQKIRIFENKGTLSIFYILCQLLLIIGGVLLIMLPINPNAMPLTYRDSGVFLYTGWRILHGEVPYIQVWDHKPPVIFLINALGVLLSNNSRWGIWIIELVCNSISAFIGFKIIKKAFGSLPAMIGMTIYFINIFFVFSGGNLTEEYSLPLQFGAMWLILNEKKEKAFWRWLLIGLLGGFAFLTKQSTVGIWIALVLYLFINGIYCKQYKKLVSEILALITGASIVIVSCVLYFYLNGSLGEFINATFLYNFRYVSEGTNPSSRISLISSIFTDLNRAGLFSFALVGFSFGLIILLKKNDLKISCKNLISVCLIDLPIEYLLLIFQGRNYAHYYLTILPVLLFFSSLLFWMIISLQNILKVQISLQLVSTVTIIGFLLLVSYTSIKDQIISYRNNNDRSMVEFITAHSTSDDYILLWGAEANINFFSQRTSPTRFVYQYPLYKKGFSNQKMIKEFLDDILLRHPKFIIDTKNSVTPFLKFEISSPEIQKKINEIKGEYFEVNRVGNWIVFEYADN